MEGYEIMRAEKGRAVPLMDVRDMNLLGRHNHENVMAAIAVASSR